RGIRSCYLSTTSHSGTVRSGEDVPRDQLLPERSPDSVLAVIASCHHHSDVQLRHHDQVLSAVAARFILLVVAAVYLERETVPREAIRSVGIVDLVRRGCFDPRSIDDAMPVP